MMRKLLLMSLLIGLLVGPAALCNAQTSSELSVYFKDYAKLTPAQITSIGRGEAVSNSKLAKVENIFYWSEVKFGLKPTLRLVHMSILQGNNIHEPAFTIAEKQLYSSHYFQTALDLTYLVRSDDPQKPGFYLLKVMGSEQAGLTGLKGSIVRSSATGKLASSLQEGLTSIKKTLEQKK